MPNKNPMKHVWMVEDVPASGAREAKSFWTKIGVAVENRDGSLSLTLAAIPVSGRMIFRDATPGLGASTSAKNSAAEASAKNSAAEASAKDGVQ